VSDLARALLAELDGEALDLFADRLAPRLQQRIGTPTGTEILLTCRQAADRAGLHVETIRRAVRSGALRAGRAGRSLRIWPADLEAWLDRGEPSDRTPRRSPRQRKAGRRPLAEALASTGQRVRGGVR
jgi:excisionase family DNA binding protein